MPTALISLLVIVGVVVGLRGSPRSSVWVLASTWLLVPGSARLPGLVGGPLFIHRVVLIAIGAGLVRSVVSGRIERSVFSVRGVHLAFAVYLTVSFVDGVLLAESRTLYRVNSNAYLNIVEQAVFFVVALALFRAIGAIEAAKIVTVIATALAALAVSEHLLTWSYAQWFTRHLNDPEGLLSLPLGQRGPHVRVRASATFALELGWIAAMLIPLTWAVAFTTRRLIAWTAPVTMTMALVWSWSRSAYAGLALGAVVLLLGVVQDRPRRVALLSFAGLAITAALVQGPLRETVGIVSASGEQDARLDRLPGIFQAVADRPSIGLGLGGLLSRRVRVVDISWVNTYATLGVLGLLAVAALLLTAIHAATRFTWSGPQPRRVIAAGAAAAIVIAPLGLLSYDLATLRASTETLWALAALALVANEELGTLPLPARRWPRVVPALAVGLGGLGLVTGVVVASTVPAKSAIDAAFTTVAPLATALNPGDQPYIDKVLAKSACAVLDASDVPASVRCQTDDRLQGGIGTVRIEARDPRAVAETYEIIEAQLHKGFRRATLEVVAGGRGRPAWAVTAPLWMAAVGVALGSIATNARSPLAATRRRAVGVNEPNEGATAGAGRGGRHEQR